jgi:ABC-type Fe3+-siderophore transport system permease subunit
MILAVAGVATMIFGAFVIGLVVALVGIIGFIGLAASNALRSHQPAHLGG